MSAVNRSSPPAPLPPSATQGPGRPDPHPPGRLIRVLAPALRWCLSLPLALALILAPPAWAAGDLLTNGDFEQPGATPAAPVPGWTFYSWDGVARVALDRDARPSGGTALHLHGTAPGKAAVHQRVHLAPGRYRLSGLAASWDLRPGRDNLTGRLFIEVPGQKPPRLDLAQGDRDWTPVELLFEVQQEMDATLYLFINGPGDLWLDDLRLTPLAADDPAAPGGRLGTPAERLQFAPPLGTADLLLAGYCAEAGQTTRPHCRRLAGADLTAVTPPHHLDSRTIASFTPPRPIGEGAGHLDLTPARGLPGDWSGSDWLDIEVENPGPRPVEGLVEIRDAQSTNYWSRVNWYTHFLPGAQRLRIPVQVFVGEKSVIKQRRRLDLKAITRLFVSVKGAEQVRIGAVRLSSDPPFTHDFPQLIKLDAGTDTSPVMVGFSALTADLGYRPERGYGFDPKTRILRSEDRRHPDNLLRDWVSIASGGLRFDLPDGEYGVWLMLEDPGYWEYVQNYDRRAILAEGREVHADGMTGETLLARVFAHQSVEDLPGDDIWQRYIPTRFRPIEFRVRVTDGQLDLDFTAGRAKTFTNTLSALLIWPLSRESEARGFIAELWERLAAQYRVEYAENPPEPPGAEPPPGPGPIPELRVFQRHWDQDLLSTDRPRPDESARSLQIALARGELEPLTLDLYPLADFSLTGAELELPGLSSEAYKVRNKLTRATDDGARYVMIPRLMDPLELPLALPAGQSRRLWFSVTPDADCPPGTHGGELRLSFADGRRLVIPVQARVRGWRLPSADLPFGWLGSVPTYTESAFPETIHAKREADIGPALALVRRHGMTQFSGGIGGVLPSKGEQGLSLDFSALDAVLTQGRPFPFPPHSYGGLAPRGMGFERYRVGDTQGTLGLPYLEALTRVLASTRAHLAGRNRAEPIYTVGDEPTGDTLANSAALADAVRAAGGQTSVFTSIVDAKSPGLALIGHVDQLFLTLHSAWGFDQIRAAGADCGTYNLAGRYARGVYQYRLHRLGCRAGYFQFAFNATHVDPYYALDGREDDFAGALPTDRTGVLIPTLDLFRFGEAVDDYRYLQALDQAIERAGAVPAAVKARKWLNGMLDGLGVAALAPPPLDREALDRIRKQAGDLVDELGGPR